VKSSSVFDRLYKSHTVASKIHYISSRAKLSSTTLAKIPARKTDVEKDLLKFNRMTISRSKRISTPHKIQKIQWGGPTSTFSTPQPRKSKKRTSPYDQTPWSAPSKSSNICGAPIATTPRSATQVYEFSPRMKPITKLYFVSKFHPGVGLEPIEPISLGYHFFQTFCEFEASGGIDSEHIAKEIFLVFFKKRFS